MEGHLPWKTEGKCIPRCLEQTTIISKRAATTVLLYLLLLYTSISKFYITRVDVVQT